MGVGDLLIHAPDARIYEVPHSNTNCLRIYRDCPEGLVLQIRTAKPISHNQKGHRRNMLAHVTLDLLNAEILRNRLNQFLEGKD